MGTSAPSKGSPSGVSFDPPWLDAIPISPIEDIFPSQDPCPTETDDDEDKDDVDTGASIAPEKRNQGARLNIGKFISTGTRSYLQKSISELTNKSFGGTRNATKRMRVTSVGAAAFGELLAAVRDGTSSTLLQWVSNVKGGANSLPELMSEITKFIIPEGGSTAEESLRNAIVDAALIFQDRHHSDDLGAFDIFNLPDSSILELVGLTIAGDIYNTVCLELQTSFDNMNYSPVDVMSRLNEVRDYICTVVEGKVLESSVQSMDRESLKKFCASVIKQTFEVFAS